MGEYVTTGIHLSLARSLQHYSRTMSLSYTENVSSKSGDSVAVLSNRERDIGNEVECRLYRLIGRRLFRGQGKILFSEISKAYIQ